MVDRWRFNPQEREQFREALGRLLLGPAYNPEKLLIEQIREAWQGQPLIGQRLGLLGLLAGPKTEPEKPREEFPMPSDYVGGPEEWAKLPESEKRKIYEALKHGRKLYIACSGIEGKRGELDSEILQAHKLKRILSG